VNHTEETKQKLSEMRKGKRNPFYGRKHTEETKRRMAEWSRKDHKTRRYIPTPADITIPTGPDLGYVAGIIDGEGSIRFLKGRPNITVYNTEEQLMRWLVFNIGGNYRVGDKRGRLPVWEWNIGSVMNCYTLCVALLPHLIIKKENAEAVIKYKENKYGRLHENIVDGS